VAWGEEGLLCGGGDGSGRLGGVGWVGWVFSSFDCFSGYNALREERRELGLDFVVVVVVGWSVCVCV
jgi:hypothetical protein